MYPIWPALFSSTKTRRYPISHSVWRWGGGLPKLLLMAETKFVQEERRGAHVRGMKLSGGEVSCQPWHCLFRIAPPPLPQVPRAYARDTATKSLNSYELPLMIPFTRSKKPTNWTEEAQLPLMIVRPLSPRSPKAAICETRFYLLNYANFPSNPALGCGN